MCTRNRTEGSNPSLSAENRYLMQAKLDHVVLWVADPLRSLEFFVNVIGLTPIRAYDSVRARRRCRASASPATPSST